MPDAIMLFAAGFGTRMGALTAARPKPLINVGGLPLLDHALALTDRAPLKTRIVNTHYLADQIANHLDGRDVLISHETPDILDTGGGLRHALPHLGSYPVFTLNTDAVWTGPNPLLTLKKAWDPERMEALLLLVPTEQARGHGPQGDFDIGEGGRLRRGASAVYSGAQIIKTDRLHDWPERVFSLNALWNQMDSEGTLFGVTHPGGWCDVGRPEGIALAEAMLRDAEEATHSV